MRETRRNSRQSSPWRFLVMAVATKTRNENESSENMARGTTIQIRSSAASDPHRQGGDATGFGGIKSRSPYAGFLLGAVAWLRRPPGSFVFPAMLRFRHTTRLWRVVGFVQQSRKFYLRRIRLSRTTANNDLSQRADTVWLSRAHFALRAVLLGVLPLL